jgi:GntR family transcriptional regulator/MocR family aminotransferase
MAKKWANHPVVAGVGGADLYLDLTGAGGRRERLTRALREAVRTGRLAPGARLPPSRTLAADLGLARNTVADAYGELVAEGWLTARQGSGTRVAQRAEPVPRPHPRPGPPSRTGAHTGARTRAGDREGSDFLRSLQRPFLHDLRPGTPDVSAFPRQAWLTSARRALTAAPADAFSHGDVRGRPELRHALAGYLARARGVRADPGNIVICGGFVQGLTLLARVLPGEAALEAYGLGPYREVLADAGVRTRPLPVDAHGADIARLDRLPSVRTALLTPAHQFPTGVPLRPDRRAAVIDWARRGDGLVLEDDYDGEFRYDRQPVGAVQSLGPERVCYLGTASKSLAPTLRLAWMVLPEDLVDPVIAAKTPAEWISAVPDQLTLADFIRSGAYDRHLRAMRQRYRRRRDRLVTALAERVPRVRVTGIAAGMHAILELPRGAQETAVREAAERRGLGVTALSSFRYPALPGDAEEPGPALVVGYGSPAEHAFTAALEALCSVLEAELGGG